MSVKRLSHYTDDERRQVFCVLPTLYFSATFRSNFTVTPHVPSSCTVPELSCSSAVPPFVQAVDGPTCHLILEVVSPTLRLVSNIIAYLLLHTYYRLLYLKISFFYPFFPSKQHPCHQMLSGVEIFPNKLCYRIYFQVLGNSFFVFYLNSHLLV